MNGTHIQISRVTKRFGHTAALDDVDFTVNRGEMVCLLGPSGCGKTTVLRVIAGLEKPDSGRVLVDGKDITTVPPGKRSFGIVFQNYALFPNLTVFKNVSYGLRGRGLDGQVARAKVEDMLALVGLEGLQQRYPAQLSGGQQQRVALARALVLSPDFLLLDEPLSALDAKVRLRLRSEIREVQRRLGVTTIMVTHDQEEALTMSDKVVVMNNARIEQIGDPRVVYERPATPFVADFVGSVNFFSRDDLQGMVTAERDLVAIRPEHITLESSATARECRRGLPGVVREVEFCGSFYRVTVEARLPGTSRPHLVTVNATPDAIRSSRVCDAPDVCLHLPADHLLHFSNGDHVAVNQMAAAV
jgi:iron(III) transport system ATP-binding protein